MRGERHEDKIRFKGKDVERVFQMGNLVHDVQNIDYGYTKEEDYEILFVNDHLLSDHLRIEKEERGHKKRLFFTYQGLIKVIEKTTIFCLFRIRQYLILNKQKRRTENVSSSHTKDSSKLSPILVQV